MYPEVACPSRLLYSIYTSREPQCNITNNSYAIYSSDKKDVVRSKNRIDSPNLFCYDEREAPLLKRGDVDNKGC
jgi:hypothetical protein